MFVSCVEFVLARTKARLVIGGLSAFAVLVFSSAGYAEEFVLSQLTIGFRHACALMQDQSLFCWGDSAKGQLGFGNLVARRFPTPLPRGASTGMRQLVAGFDSNCAVFEDGRVKCWGANESGQLGLGSDSTTIGGGFNQELAKIPFVDLGTGVRARSLFAGHRHFCAVLTDGGLKCWGLNLDGQLGLGDKLSRGRTPDSMGDNLPRVSLGTGLAVAQGCGGSRHNCALLNDGNVKCWGTAKALGIGKTTGKGTLPNQMGDNLSAVLLGTGAIAKKLACGNLHSCALLADGRVKCWGTNSFGALGIGKPANAVVGEKLEEMGDALPAVDLVAGLETIDLACGYDHCCSVLENAAVKCWGYNQQYQTGAGDSVSRGISAEQMGDGLPYVDLGRLAEARSVSLGQFQSCAHLANGETKCWGWNAAGQLGNGTLNDIGSVPSQLGDNLPALKFGKR